MTYGEKIKQRREEINMSVAELAERTGVSSDFIYNLESGYRKEPTFTKGMKIAQALGISADDLASDETHLAPA